MTIVKARFGNDIRKFALHHSNDLTLNDLVLMLQRIFSIKSAENILLKYKDAESDLVTLVDDTDLLLALQDSQLSVEVTIDSGLQQISEIQEQVSKIQADVQSLARSLAAFHVPLNFGNNSTHVETGSLPPLSQQPSLVNGLDVSFNQQAPPSPVPSEKPEVPATIQPSLQEQVLPDGVHREMSAPVEEEIPLEAGSHMEAYPPVADPMQQPFIPNSGIPSFPQSNMPPPHPGYGEPQFGGAPPSAFAPPHSAQSQTPHSSVSSTPIPQPSHFAGPPQHPPFGGAPPAPQQPQFAPPTSQQQFVPPPSQQQQQPQFAPPPPMSGPGGHAPQQSFGPPPPMGAQQPPHSAPQQFAPPPPPGSFVPNSQQFNAPPAEPAPPSGHPNFPPQQQFGVPQQFQGPPQQQFGAPPMGGPPGAFPPSMGPPGSLPGGPGVNPFARGPGGPPFRQSPYHQQ